jgi:CheY-like chemotaxis protein
MKFGKIANLEERKKITSILLVDDEEPNLRQLSEILNENYAVIKASSAKEAIEILKQNIEISIIISDQRMPEMTGTELFEFLENQRHPAMRIILTGFADMQNVVQAINKSNVFRYLNKPVNFDELNHSLNSAFSQFNSNQTTLSLLAQIKELIDENGNRYQADESGSTFYYNLKDNFAKNSQVNVQLTNIDNNGSKNPAFTSLNGDTTIFRPVTLWPKVILTNETGSRLAADGTVTYVTGGIAIKPFGTGSGNSTGLNNFALSVGSNSRNILTGSGGSLPGYIYSSSILNNLWIQDNSIATSGGLGGYDPITLPLVIKPNQEIRFLQNEDYTYTIISASYTGVGPATIYLHLNTNLTSSITSSLNRGYLIREYTEDSSKIVINKSKPEGYTGPGYIIPQYMSSTLTTNFDKIVSNLKENGVL